MTPYATAKPMPVVERKLAVQAVVSDVDALVQGEFAGSSVGGAVELQATPSSGCSGKNRVTWSAWS